jgi:hypothetical protein
MRTTGAGADGDDDDDDGGGGGTAGETLGGRWQQTCRKLSEIMLRSK